uniref:Uncharacterized protein n=1 Tax=Rhipicephalus appendiculatus TaxID=34631 RepID=A0A131YF08_RHIAP
MLQRLCVGFQAKTLSAGLSCLCAGAWSVFSLFTKKKMVTSCNCAVKMSTPCECMCVLSVRMMLHHVVTPRKIVLNGDANFSLKVQLLFASAHSSWQEP